MHKLPEVQEAKELMNQAKDWSVIRWLFEKPRVRQAADRANAALDRLNRTVKARWSDEVKATYKTLNHAARRPEAVHQQPESAASAMSLLLEKVIDADNVAHRARAHAERAFDEAERRMSTDLAKEGCKKAIHSWELHEKAIRKAQAIVASDLAEQ